MSKNLTERVDNAMETAPVVGCMKNLMMVFNLIFWVTGVILLAIGIWSSDDLNDLIKLSSVYEPGPYYVLIVIGAIIILGGALACFATIKGQHFLLYILSGLLVGVFIIELSSGAAMLAYREKLDDGFERGLILAMDNYLDRDGLMDKLQERLECCGLDKYSDWYDDRNVSSRWEGDQFFPAVPESCCWVREGCRFEGPWPEAEEDIKTRGCREPVLEHVKGVLGPVGGAALGTAFFTLLGAINAVLLARSIDKSKYETV